MASSYLWHGRLALEPPPHTIVDALGLPPAGVNAFESIALVSVEALGVCSNQRRLSATSSKNDPAVICGGTGRISRGNDDLRFLTIATCLFATTMVNRECDGSGRWEIDDGGCRSVGRRETAMCEIWMVRGLGKASACAKPVWAIARELRSAQQSAATSIISNCAR
jgi:hypothetical protein